MAGKLLIVESPAKAKTIGKYLGKDFTVLASVGHVRDLPKSNKNAIDIEGGFVPRYEISKGKEHVIAGIAKEAKKADEVYLATDPDREGEAIAWHLAELMAKSAKKVQRVTYNEITKEAIQEALEHPREIDQNLRRAQEARRVLDRLVGYDLSGLIWKKVRYGLSAGRVQSPALRIIMEREREIRAFVPEDYWTITATLLTEGHETFDALCTEEPREKTEVERILKHGNEGAWYVRNVAESETKRSPKPPFTTSTLQQSASTRLGFSPSRTMRAAQKLYEAGYITYMRTDSTTLAGSAIAHLAEVIERKYGKQYLETRQYKTKSKNAQEAHEAVRPTDPSKVSAGSTEDEKRLYQLIWMRAVASQMSDAKLIRTKITTNIRNDGRPTSVIPDFHANGSRVVFDGWLKADTAARGEDVELPKVAQDEALILKALTDEAKQTKPPDRYTEAGLIKELEKRGIGRPSTYASIMKTLQDREYVVKEGRTLIPTDTGDVVSSFLEQNFEKYISDTFTAEMENELDQIANGERDYGKTLEDFYGPFVKDVAAKEHIEKLTNLGDVSADITCPTCGSAMVMKLGKNGKFMSCSRFPECDGARMADGKEIAPDAPIGVYPDTGEPIYLLSGRFGPYLQVGETPKGKGASKMPKPRRASVPAGVEPTSVTLEQALKYLSLPRDLGAHPESGKMVMANTGKFGPYIVHDGDFRSLKTDSPYDITLERALEILKEEKKTRPGTPVKFREVGVHPRTKKPVVLYKAKDAYLFKKGFKRVYLPKGVDPEKLTVEDALEILKGT
jgi:DNA topoisomerase-1